MARLGDADLRRLFFQIARIRAFERALASLWQQGLISGELHLGIGEEAAVAGVVDHLVDGDSLALDHRSTPALLASGTDPTELVLEMLGSPDGLCHGMGGHMHLFDPERLAGSSGIVGASGPLGCGFALAAQQLRPGAVSVAFFGEGAVNQGMLMESLNLAAAWALPVIFVCKNSGLAVTTRSRTVTAGRLIRRAASFNVATARRSGSDVAAVWLAAGQAIARARHGGGPTFLEVRCRRPEGHFQGDPLLRVSREPAASSADIGPPLLQAVTAQPGAPLAQRVHGLARLVPPIVAGVSADRLHHGDPLVSTRRRLGQPTADRIEAEARQEITAAAGEAMCRSAGAKWPA